MSLQSSDNPQPGQLSTLKNMQPRWVAFEPMTWSCDTGQWMPCFDSCHLTTKFKWISNIKLHAYCKLENCKLHCIGWPVWVPRCVTSSYIPARKPMPLTIMTMRKWMHGFYRYGAPHGGLGHRSFTITICDCLRDGSLFMGMTGSVKNDRALENSVSLSTGFEIFIWLKCRFWKRNNDWDTNASLLR